ncbi:MAG TPA: hypothetical protein VMU39_13935 [Solirubrobacteraceae bacterium]|nr:hypothetical protein [Solirubrobacteraceae bacterium]
MISTGSVEANVALGLRSCVALDTDFAIGRRLGARGTPMAVRIGADRRIATQVAAGADAVLRLLQDGDGRRNDRIEEVAGA